MRKSTKGTNDMEIKVQKLKEDELKKMSVFAWPIWTKEISRFDWHYDSVEECYLLEGEVMVESKDGKKVSFGKGDFVIFPKGLSCTWDIKNPCVSTTISADENMWEFKTTLEDRKI